FSCITCDVPEVEFPDSPAMPGSPLPEDEAVQSREMIVFLAEIIGHERTRVAETVCIYSGPLGPRADELRTGRGLSIQVESPVPSKVVRSGTERTTIKRMNSRLAGLRGP